MQYEDVKELIDIFEKNKDLTELELSIDNVEIRLNRGEVKGPKPPMPFMPYMQMPQGGNNQTVNVAAGEDNVPKQQEASSEAKAEAAGTGEAVEGNVVKAPIVGTFYQSSSPDKPPFVQVGDKINKGDVICIIEAMKFMNEIQSEYSGTVAEILVDNEEFVEYGQELFRIV